VVVEGTDIAVSIPNADEPILTGKLVKAWAMGSRYEAKYPDGKYIEGNLDPFSMPRGLLRDGRIFFKDKPQYADKAPINFVDVTGPPWNLDNTGDVQRAEDNRAKLQLAIGLAALQGKFTTFQTIFMLFRFLILPR
jgi:hypothetical protein